MAGADNVLAVAGDNVGKDDKKRALSIRQPHVELIMRGEKRYEFRLHPTRLRGRVWLYANLGRVAKPALCRKLGALRRPLSTGAIVGAVGIVDCYWNYRLGKYAHTLSKPWRLKVALAATNQPQPRFWIPGFRPNAKRRTPALRRG